MGTHPIFESDFDCLTDPFRATQKLKMRYVAAYLLAQLGGNAGPGVDADEEKLSKVISELAGKNIDDVLAEGKAKLASVPSGGGAGPAAAAGAAAEEAPKEEEKKETSESEDDDMGFDLFG